jgi:hypothetical protein
MLSAIHQWMLTASPADWIIAIIGAIFCISVLIAVFQVEGQGKSWL